MEWNKWTVEELRRKLDELEDDLDEVTLEKTMVLSQTGLHISSKKIMQQSKEFAESIERLSGEIAAIEEELKRRSQ